MKIKKEDLLELLKKNGLDEAAAEKALEAISKGLLMSVIDLAKKAVIESENDIDDAIFGMGEEKLRELVSNIEITL